MYVYTVVRLYSCTIVYNCTIVQLYNCTIVQLYSFTVIQFLSCTVEQSNGSGTVSYSCTIVHLIMFLKFWLIFCFRDLLFLRELRLKSKDKKLKMGVHSSFPTKLNFCVFLMLKQTNKLEVNNNSPVNHFILFLTCNFIFNSNLFYTYNF